MLIFAWIVRTTKSVRSFFSFFSHLFPVPLMKSTFLYKIFLLIAQTLRITLSLSATLYTVFLQPQLFAQNSEYTQSPVFIECSDNANTEHKFCSHAQVSATHLAALQRWKAASLLHDGASDSVRGYDVLRYDLALDWTASLLGTGETGAVRRYTGIQTITLRAVRRLESIVLDAERSQLRIDTALAITTSAGARLLTVAQNDQTCTITGFGSLSAEDTLVLRLFYTHVGMANNADGLGFFLYQQGRLGAVRRSATMLDTVYVPERLAYTMSQPFGARRWMPCNDTPADKALVRLRVRVPLGFTAVANGLVQARERDGVSETVTFALRSPAPPYLLAVSASKYESYTEYYKRVNNPNDSIPVEHFFWKADDTSLEQNNFYYNARATFQHTIPAMTAYSQWFGEYPFEKYGHVVVQPFFAGGMEHQTMSTINRSWLRGSATGIAHEIMHQWFGDKVTCASWEHIWLNEGAATYGEALWYESWGGLRWYNVAFEGFKRSYFQGNYRPPLFVQNPNSIETIFNYATTYVKGAYVHHMLRRMLGDSTYFRAMRLFQERYSVATTADLQRVFEEVAPNSPISLKQFFQQWVYGAQHPLFTASWRSVPNLNKPLPVPERVLLTVSQLQTGTNVPGVFHCALPIAFVRGADTLTRTAIITEQRQLLTFDLPFLPEQILLDPNENILAEKQVPVRLLGNEPILAIVENPVRAASPLEVLLTLPQKEVIVLDVADVLGRSLQTLYAGLCAEGAHSFREQVHFPAAGTYFVRLQSSSGVKAAKLLVVR